MNLWTQGQRPFKCKCDSWVLGGSSCSATSLGVLSQLRAPLLLSYTAPRYFLFWCFACLAAVLASLVGHVVYACACVYMLMCVIGFFCFYYRLSLAVTCLLLSTLCMLHTLIWPVLCFQLQQKQSTNKQHGDLCICFYCERCRVC